MAKGRGKTKGKKSVKIKDLPRRPVTSEQAKAAKGGIVGPETVFGTQIIKGGIVGPESGPVSRRLK